ncbi:hypothetical protein [Myceligenerans xiligouense]|uniref:Uncharacterized protein n=1 Tax=Myceligenerans xiligouense TaxID=253184 RepID=A0A3N4YWU4_9MICO|nr:hypothetical protein [Myceligenerans xiligouense]RPF23130.1 hypothetical protein EDD34_3811 [Myceligenerans xiligouense]
MATRRKRSRSGRPGARAGSPPTSNALEWAERLANGEEPPQPSALEWAESLAKDSDPQDPAASNPWGTSPAESESSPAPFSPFGPTGTDSGSRGTDTPDTPAPFGAAAPADPGTATDDDGAPGWGTVPSEPPARRSRRTRGSKGTDTTSPGTAAADTPQEPSAVADGPAAPTRSRRSARTQDEPAGGRTKRRSAPGRAGRRPDADAAGGGPEKRSGGSGSRPRGRAATAGSAKPSGRTVRRILTKGLPKSADRPAVLIVAAVVAVALGLGVGWATSFFDSGENLAATPQQCAAAQTAWTKAANAQTGISEDEPASVRSGFIEARDAMAAVDDVPPGIADDWESAHGFYTTVADALEAKKAGDAEGIAEAAQIASTKVDTDDMIATSKRITRYVNANCDA